MASPIRPISPSGMPSSGLNLFQEVPPSSVKKRPEPGPPEVK